MEDLVSRPAPPEARTEPGRRTAAEASAPSPRSYRGPLTRFPEINVAESPLAWLARRRDRDGRPMISGVQFEAGERLRADLRFAEMTPRVTANWSAIGQGVGGQEQKRDEWPRIAGQPSGSS